MQHKTSSINTCIVASNMFQSDDPHKEITHCMKSLQIPSFFCSLFPVFRLTQEKYVSEKTPYLDTSHLVIFHFARNEK